MNSITKCYAHSVKRGTTCTPLSVDAVPIGLAVSDVVHVLKMMSMHVNQDSTLREVR